MKYMYDNFIQSVLMRSYNQMALENTALAYAAIFTPMTPLFELEMEPQAKIYFANYELYDPTYISMLNFWLH